MKKILYPAVGLFALSLAPVIAQPPSTPPPANFQQRLQAIVERANPPENQPPHLTKFTLNFSGGTPSELVKAIEKAMGKPLNAIIPTEDADIQLPPLKMNDVTTVRLFAALEASSRKTVAVQGNGTGTFGGYPTVTIDYGFTTDDNPATDTSIWYFHAKKPSLPPIVSTEKVCRFYSLIPYLDRGFTVDDITTAIQTGWKMAGVTPLPELNYHKETKLLIAFGEPGQLQTIDYVLQTLGTYESQYQINNLFGQIDRMNSQITRLQDQINQLKNKKVSPEEKSGK